MYALPVHEIEEPFCSVSSSCLCVWIAENSEVENMHNADKALQQGTYQVVQMSFVREEK
jgi:hypothetical protein